MILRTPTALVLSVAAALASACGEEKKPAAAPENPVKVTANIGTTKLDKLARIEFNRRAAELDLPIFWRTDANADNALEPDELAVLWGVAESKRADWTDGKMFTPKMDEAYKLMLAKDDWSKAPPDEQKRRQLVVDELAQGRATLVETDLTKGSPEDKALVDNVMDAAKIIEKIYAKQMGVENFAAQLSDPASKELFYRNQGPWCEAPKTEKSADCNALAARPKKVSGLYPAYVQSGVDTKFCEVLEKRKDADKLMFQFAVVKPKAGGCAPTPDNNCINAADAFEAVPYTVEYKGELEAISKKLKAAADAVVDPKEAPLKAYLEASSASFQSGDWQPADEAWAKMNAVNSKWYLRIGPDEVYTEPCSRKALFHVSFAKINPDSLEWQKKLEPVKNDMEAALADIAGAPYTKRAVTFHLPDFIDIVLNAGDSRNALGATIGQSLPNWGPVANEGRGRTVAMVNLYTDKDSEDTWRSQTSSLFCKETMDKASFDPKLAVMSTVLHEAAHNLGPAHEYKVKGKTDDQIFGGPLASMLEELKAQTSALFFADWLVGKNVVTQAQADDAHLRDVTWAFGHIAQGMYDGNNKPKPYSQLASIQMGALFKAGALVWKADGAAANGTDKGCIAVDLAKWKAAVADLEKTVLHIKGAGDKAVAEKVKKEFVDDAGPWADAKKIIQERWLRQPKASFVYAVNE